MSKVRAGWWFWWPVALCWLLPVLALVVVVPLTDQRRVQAVTQDAGDTVVVAERAQTLRQSVDLLFTLDEVAVARIGVGGVVTSVDVAVGDVMTQGRTIVSLDAIARRAYMNRLPLYRELGVGDTGADVVALHEYLSELGQADVPTGSAFTARTARAVREFQKGVGAPLDGRFRPGYVVYVHEGADVVGSLRVSLGEVLAAESPVFEGRARPSQVRAESPDGSPIPVLTSGQAVVVTRQEASLELAPGPWTAKEAAQLLDIFGEGVAASGESDAPAQSQVRVAGVQVELKEPRRAGAVPGTAVLTTHAGVRCLFVLERQDTTSTPSPMVVQDVDLVVGELGVAAVPAELIGRTVLRDPAALPGEVRSECA